MSILKTKFGTKTCFRSNGNIGFWFQEGMIFPKMYLYTTLHKMWTNAFFPDIINPTSTLRVISMSEYLSCHRRPYNIESNFKFLQVLRLICWFSPLLNLWYTVSNDQPPVSMLLPHSNSLFSTPSLWMLHNTILSATSMHHRYRHFIPKNNCWRVHVSQQIMHVS